MNVGVEPGRDRVLEALEEGLARERAGSLLHVVADELGLGLVADDQVVAARELEGARAGGARLLVVVLAVDHGGDVVLRVGEDAPPDVHDRAAGRVDEDAALPAEDLEVLGADTEGRDDHHVLGRHVGERVAALPVRAVEEPDAELDEPPVHERVVDDLVRYVDRLPREVPVRLVGEVDRAVDAVAEAELLRELEGHAPAREREPVLADPVHEPAVVVVPEDVLYLLLETEAFLDVEGRIRHEGDCK